MPDKPNNFARFWQELKRRKVFQVIAMYAATAFIIMEAGDIMLPRLGLPDWTVTFIIVLLIIGFPISIILSWIFDITHEGVKKTEPVKVAKEKEAEAKPAKRKLRVSDVIIAALLVMVVILAYPKIFKKDKFEDIRDEYGRISIVVMPFQNLTGDTLYAGMELGLQNLLITKLSNSDELSVRQTQTMYDILGDTPHLNYASITPSIASDIAFKLDANTVILGSIHKSGNNLRITANLLDSRNEEIYKSYEIDGDSEDDFFTLTDSLTTLIKNHLEIKVLEQDMNKEIRSYAETGSAEAYRYFSKGLKKFWIQDFEAASNLFVTALEIDPDFFNAAWWLIPTYLNMSKNLQARQVSEKLNKQIDHFTYAEQLIIKYWKSYFNRNPQESINYAKLIVEENPMQRAWVYQLGNEYYRIERYRDAIQAYEKALELDRNWGGGWKWVWSYVGLGEVYHEIGQHTKEKEIYELGLSVLPDHPLIIWHQAVCELSNRDTIEASKLITKYQSICKDLGHSVSEIEDNIGFLYEESECLEKAQEHYKLAINSEPVDDYTIWAMNNLAYLLVVNDINISEGILLIDLALGTNPTDEDLLASIYHTKGWGLIKQGKNREALEHLKKALYLRGGYEYKHYLQIKKVEQSLANQNK